MQWWEQRRGGERWVEHKELILAPALGPPRRLRWLGLLKRHSLPWLVGWSCHQSYLNPELTAVQAFSGQRQASCKAETGKLSIMPRQVALKRAGSQLFDSAVLHANPIGFPLLGQWSAHWWPKLKSCSTTQLRTGKYTSGSPSRSLH